MTVKKIRCIPAVMAIAIITGLYGCGNLGGGGVLFPPTASATIAPTATVTPIPPALSVNGTDISLQEFNAELARYQQAQSSLGKTSSLEDARKAVQNDMVDTLLLSQGAETYGFAVDDATLQSRIDRLTSEVGGADALSAWESSHGYTDTDFRSTLRHQIEAAWMRDHVIASVPKTAEQVHVKQILLYNSTDAQQVLGQLQAGASFDTLANRYNPLTNGDLGWFPRRYLPDAAIEEAAFALQVGQYSAVIQDETGYHILYLVERDPAHQLSPDALLTLQTLALTDWLTQRRNESTIIITP